MLAIMKDIVKGNLPLSELPKFTMYMFGKTFWFWFSIILLGGFVIVIFK
jgi:hypothetical protein